MSTLRSAWRSIIHHPLYVTLSTVTLGLGIGVCVSNFATVDALVLRPLLLPDLDRLVMVGTQRSIVPNLGGFSPPDYAAFAAELTTLERFSVFSFDSVNVSSEGAEPERLHGTCVSAAFFASLGVQPILGRAFLRDEEEPGRGRVVLLSEAVWKRRFGGDPKVLERDIDIDGEAHRVVGVMSRDVRVPPQSQLWLPLQLDAHARADHKDFFLNGVARLRPGATMDSARTELAAIAQRQSRKYPDSHREFRVTTRPIREEISGPETASYSWIMLASSLFLLLLACSNVANLHYARLSARSREFAVRTALGASRLQVVSQLLSESTLLGLLGGMAGIFLGAWGTDLMRGTMPAEVEVFLPGWQRMSVNGRVLAAAIVLSLVAGLLAGLASAFSGFLTSPGDVLKESGRGTAGGRVTHRTRNLLVVTQMILSIVLLTGASLTIRGFQRIANPLLAGEPSQVLTMTAALPVSRYKTDVEVRRFHRDLGARLQSLPGVAASALASDITYSGDISGGPFLIEGRPAPLNRQELNAQRSQVTPGYFSTFGIKLVRGRLFSDRDREESARVAVVNETFARRYFPGQDVIGQRVRWGFGPGAAPPNAWMEILGVTADVRHHPIDNQIRPMIYRPLDQAPPRAFYLALRAEGDVMAMAPAVRQAVFAIDRQQPVEETLLLSTRISHTLTGYRYVAASMGIMGGLALLLSAVGLYSVMAFFVTERTHEIGIRMAMGAAAASVVSHVVTQGLKLAGVGLAIGLALAVLVARALASLLFGVTATDVVSLSVAVLILLASALLACWIPARRAAAVDPMTALRHR